jgi:hypothetical protein
MELTLVMPWRHKWGSVYIAWVIPNLGAKWGLSGQPTLYMGKEPWDTFSRRLLTAHSQFCCQMNKDITSLCVIFVRLRAHMLSTKHRISWVGRQCCYLMSVTYHLPRPVGHQLGILQHWFLGQKCDHTDVVVQVKHRSLIPGFLECVLLWTDSCYFPSDMQLKVIM